MADWSISVIGSQSVLAAASMEVVLAYFDDPRRTRLTPSTPGSSSSPLHEVNGCVRTKGYPRSRAAVEAPPVLGGVDWFGPGTTWPRQPCASTRVCTMDNGRSQIRGVG